jgi:hypothetical protein
MDLRKIHQVLTRSPFAVRKETEALPDFPTHAPRSAQGRHNLLLFGHAESAMHLSQLEALRDAVAGRTEMVRGIVAGTDFGAVERTLNAIGFNTAENLHAIGTTRRFMRFREPETGTFWHVADTELARLGPVTIPAEGDSCVIPGEIRFGDWVNVSGNRMRHRISPRVVTRPTRLDFVSTFTLPDSRGYDGLAGITDPDEIIARLRRLHPVIGLNALMFLRNVIILATAYGQALSTQLLHNLVTDRDARQKMLEYVAANPDTLPRGERFFRIQEAFDDVWAIHACVPKMAVEVVDTIFTSTYRGRELVTLDDLLIPGTIWHVDTSTPAGRFTALCMKEDLQRRLLSHGPARETSVIFTSDWDSAAAPELDLLCLERRDILQCHAAPNASAIVAKHGDTARAVIQGVPRIFWHVSPTDAEIALFGELNPAVKNPRQVVAYLPLNRRIEINRDGMQEVEIDINIDGTAEQELSRKSKLSRIVDRGGFAVD